MDTIHLTLSFRPVGRGGSEYVNRSFNGIATTSVNGFV